MFRFIILAFIISVTSSASHTGATRAHTPESNNTVAITVTTSPDLHQNISHTTDTHLKAYQTESNALPTLACALLVAPLMMYDYWYSAPLYLAISPLATYVILDFRNRSSSHHARTGMKMAVVSLLTAELAAIVHCTPDLHVFRASIRPLMTSSIVCGITQMMLVLNKTDIPRVMICTACAVIGAVLSFAPLFTTISIGSRCFQCCALPILFLFWQSADCVAPGISGIV